MINKIKDMFKGNKSKPKSSKKVKYSKNKISNKISKVKKSSKKVKPQESKARKPKKQEYEKQEVPIEDEREWPRKVKAILVVEIMGAPKEHIENTMQLYLKNIKENKSMIVEQEELSDVEQKDSFFLQFVEITAEFKTVKTLIDFCFDYMPSSVEIIEPEKITYNSYDLSDIVNDLQARLHQLDMIVKNQKSENKMLNENANLLLRNLILIILKEEKTIKEISKIAGLDEEIVEERVKEYVEKGLLDKKRGKYKRNN